MEPNEYANAVFQCEVSSQVELSAVTWEKDGEKLTTSSKYTINCTGRCHYLKIHGVEVSDQGKYSCTLVKSKETTSAVLNVLGELLLVESIQMK